MCDLLFANARLAETDAADRVDLHLVSRVEKDDRVQQKRALGSLVSYVVDAAEEIQARLEGEVRDRPVAKAETETTHAGVGIARFVVAHQHALEMEIEPPLAAPALLRWFGGGASTTITLSGG